MAGAPACRVPVRDYATVISTTTVSASAMPPERAGQGRLERMRFSSAVMFSLLPPAPPEPGSVLEWRGAHAGVFLLLLWRSARARRAAMPASPASS